MNTICHPYSHYYLYAKGFYETSDDIIFDLKKIQAHVLLIPIECIEDHNVFKMVLNIAIETIFNEYPQNAKEKITSFIFSMNLCSYQENITQDKSIILNIIKHSLSILRMAKIYELDIDGEISKKIINLCLPDQDILPISKHGQTFEILEYNIK